MKRWYYRFVLRWYDWILKQLQSNSEFSNDEYQKVKREVENFKITYKEWDNGNR